MIDQYDKAITGAVLSIEGENAIIDVGGVIIRANLSLVDARVGDVVLIHSGFAIKVLDLAESNRLLEKWRST